MDINDRNIMIKNLKDEIKEKQQYLHEKFKELENNKSENNKSENNYLESVKNDYEKNLDQIKITKKKQLNAFINISKYLDKLSGQFKTIDTFNSERKYDQKLVINEINKLKQ
tara:strand:+ start:573 stop:908 length:336 start_codon:yes stop_codon:yes gene_type:complete